MHFRILFYQYFYANIFIQASASMTRTLANRKRTTMTQALNATMTLTQKIIAKACGRGSVMPGDIVVGDANFGLGSIR